MRHTGKDVSNADGNSEYIYAMQLRKLMVSICGTYHYLGKRHVSLKLNTQGGSKKCVYIFRGLQNQRR